jgi:hypothetical protein
MDEHGVANPVGEALGREVIYKPIVIADFRRQLEQFGLPGGPGFEPRLTESDGVFGRSACPSWG